MPFHKAYSNSKGYDKTFQKTLNLVVAYTFNKQGIGKNGTLPWHIIEDMKHFKEITVPNKKPFFFSIVIMGRKTWDSIPESYKPLSNRYNIILSNDEAYKKSQMQKYASIFNNNNNINNNNDWKSGVKFTTWDAFFNEEYIDVEYILRNKVLGNIQSLDSLQSLNGVPITFNYYIIGGESIYQKALESKLNLYIYATEIYTQSHNIIDCDTFFPKIDKTIITNISSFNKSINQVNNYDVWYRFITYAKIIQPILFNTTTPFPTAENKYLELMSDILEKGQTNYDRTGVGTLSIFGTMLKYNLQDTFPISTTKRIFFRAIFEELMLYLSGKTYNAILQDKGIHVWDGNTSRDFLDKRGLTDYIEGDMGQTYGFNMRHFGGIYKGCKTDYSIGNYGYDQLANIINLIKTDPYSRRIIIDLWDSSTVDKTALPSCLCKYQFNVNVVKKELNLAIYLRSSDYFLANNWNTCTGALLVHLLCNLEGINLNPGELTVFIADAHIYKTHIEHVKLNLERSPYPFPKLLVCNGNSEKKKKDILDFKFEDLELLGYKAHPTIKADMAI